MLERIFGSQEAASSRPKTGPESRVGQRCRVWYEADDDWYEAVIRGYDRHTRLHNVWYPYDEEVRCWSRLALSHMLGAGLSASVGTQGLGDS